MTPVATHRRTRLEGVLAVLGEIRGGGPVWDVESGGPVGVLVADCQRLQSRARLKPGTMIVTFQGFSPTHDFFDYTGPVSCSASASTLALPSHTSRHGRVGEIWARNRREKLLAAAARSRCWWGGE